MITATAKVHAVPRAKHMGDGLTIFTGIAGIVAAIAVPLWLHFKPPTSLPFLAPTKPMEAAATVPPKPTADFAIPIVRQGSNNIDLQFNSDGSITWRRL